MEIIINEWNDIKLCTKDISITYRGSAVGLILKGPNHKARILAPSVLQHQLFSSPFFLKKKIRRKKRERMFEIGADSKPAEKCYVTHGPLPAYIDPKQPPTKRRPFSTILNHTFSHTVLGFVVRFAMSFANSYLEA